MKMTLPSGPLISPLATSNRTETLRNFCEEPCLDCNMSSPQCSEPHCPPFGALTTQCTDQCVVITCNDHHAESSLCDNPSQCNDNVDCAGCEGFEDFLQCCEDYAAVHSLPPQSHRALEPQPPHQAFCWDTSFTDNWCNDCTTKSTGFERQLDSNMSRCAIMHAAPQPSLYQRGFSPSYREHNFQMSSYPQIASDGRPPFTCMWGSCGLSFASSSELIEHVNFNHLTSSSSAFLGNDIVLPHDPPFEPVNPPTTCKWADCTTQAVSSFNDTHMLAYHLLHEHLGVTSPPAAFNKTTPIHQSTTSESFSFDPTISQESVPQSNLNGDLQRPRALSDSTSPVREEVPHSCTGVHECKWKGCESFFPTCAELTLHITAAHIGSGHAQYECFWDNCLRNGENGFQSKQKICRHVQSHTGHRPFQCVICQQYFSEAATLQQHIRRHTQEKPYVCDYPGCGKSFAITGALTIHKRTHNGDKPFKCSHCERGFAESSNLSKHLRTHTGVKPYLCTEPNCGKAFARPDQLNRHKTIHKKKHRGVESDG